MNHNPKFRLSRLGIWLLALSFSCGGGEGDMACPRDLGLSKLTPKKAEKYLADSQAYLEKRQASLQSEIDQWADKVGLTESDRQALRDKLSEYYQMGVEDEILAELPFDPQYADTFGLSPPEIRYPHRILFRHVFGDNHPAEADYLTLVSQTSFAKIFINDSFFNDPFIEYEEEIRGLWHEYVDDLKYRLGQLQARLPELFTPEELSRGWGRWYDQRDEVDLFDLLALEVDTPLFCFQEGQYPIQTYDLIPVSVYLMNTIPRDFWPVHGLDVWEDFCSENVLGTAATAH